MRIIMCLALVLVSAVFFTGCATVATPLAGGIYMDVKAPLAATNSSASSKMGTSTASSILGLVAMGDASIQAAAKNGNITKISHVDYHSTSILGIYSTFTVEVYGE
ncbi:MAG: TRL-like family protein [Endomicrobiales bacterium]|jgi:hypothetical protein